MTKTLPPRPNLDHLRKQAKALLAAIEAGEPAAIATMTGHHPAARRMSAAQVRAARFRLADAQSAVARQTGFESWPRLARHVELLRALEGTWEFASLEIDGSQIPTAGLVHSRLLIDGDRFRTESPEATYEGIFNIDVEAEPNGIDIEFVAGPEAGKWNYGVFRLEADQLELCLDMSGKGRPKGFRTSPGSGHALETLRRASRGRPDEVNGGTAANGAPRPAAPAGATEPARFAYVASPTLTRLQGEWTAEKVVRDGQELPAMMLKTAHRTAKANEVKISFGVQVMIHALVRIDESSTPMHIDYSILAGPSKGMLQQGIMQWRGDIACFCMASPGKPRPTDFSSTKGNGNTLSHWKPAN